jgi:hypothetical protein
LAPELSATVKRVSDWIILTFPWRQRPPAKRAAGFFRPSSGKIHGHGSAQIVAGKTGCDAPGFTRLNSFLDDFAHPPSFGSAQWSGLSDHHLVTNLAPIAFIMGSKLGTSPDILMIKLFFEQPLNRDDHRFIHLVADDGSDQLPFNSSFFHGINYSSTV